MPKRTFLFALGLLLLTVGSLLGKQSEPLPMQEEQQKATIQTVQVTKVIDGDTIEIEGGRKVRYIGIDAPEMRDRRSSVQCFAKEATSENQRLVEGKHVRLEKDVSETDKFGRLLRYVFIDPSTSSGQVLFVNDHLVRQGFAQVSTFPPDVRRQSQFLQAQQEARENNRGLWETCGGLRR